MKAKQKHFIISNPCFIVLYFNLLPRILSTRIIWTSSNEDKLWLKTIYRPTRRVQDEDLSHLKKVLRSVDEEQEVTDRIEKVLRSIDEENSVHETKKRKKIAKVLETIDHHTKKALLTKKSPVHPHQVRPANMPKSKDGRTITINTAQGKKKVFIPKGWTFCTVSPIHCYSSKKTKKRSSATKKSKKKKRDQT